MPVTLELGDLLVARLEAGAPPAAPALIARVAAALDLLAGEPAAGRW